MSKQQENFVAKYALGWLSRRAALKAGDAAAAIPVFEGVSPLARATGALAFSETARASQEWPSYAGDGASSKYSPLAQIDASNFGRLKTAWTWRSVEEKVAQENKLKTWAWEATPLMMDGVLYVTTSLSQVAAVDAKTGKTLWVY